MGLLCNTCQGSGRLIGYGTTQAHGAGSACLHCQGRGYRDHHRKKVDALATVEVARVLAYDRLLGVAQVFLEETLHRGDRLIAICHGLAIDFELKTMTVAGMDLPLALRGWEVSMMVPQALKPGVWIVRKESI